MVTEKGVITKVEGNTAWVKTTKTSACESCSVKDSCHSIGGGKEMEIEAINTAAAQIGDTVVISFETVPLFKLSFLLYIFPIFSMIAGAVLGDKIAPRYALDPSGLSVLGAFLFFFFAFLIIRLVGKRLANKSEYKARIIRVSHSR